jgi:phage-related protein
MAESKLRVNLIGDASSLNRSLSLASAKLNTFSKNVSAVGASLSMRLTLPLGIAGGAAIKFASDAEESMNKVNVAFGTSSQRVQDFANTALKSFGIARSQALDMSALFGDMATGMGISQNSAADLAIQLTSLAGDLSSFKNINIEEVTTALAGVFTGETESLKRLGIVMTEVNLQQFAMDQGIKKTLKSMSQQEKIMLRMQYIMKVTANAQGDFARTSGGMANQLRIAQGSLKELAETFGRIMLPVATKVITKVNEIIQNFIGMDEATKKIIIAVSGFAAAIPPLIFLIGKIGAALGFLISPIGLVIAALAGVTYAVVKNWEPVKQAIVDVTNFIIDLYNESLGFRILIQSIGAIFKTIFDIGKAVFEGLWRIIKGVAENIIEGFKNVGKVIRGVFTLDADLIQEGITGAMEAAFSNIAIIASEAGTLVMKAGESLHDNLKEGFLKAAKADPIQPVTGESIDNFLRGIKDKVINAGKMFMDFFNTGVASAAGGVGGFGASLERSFDFSDLTSKIQNTATTSLEIIGNSFDSIRQKTIRMHETFGTMGLSFQAFFNAIGQGLTNAFDAMLNGEPVLKSLMNMLKQLISRLLAAAAAAAILSALFPGMGSFAKLFGGFSGLGGGGGGFSGFAPINPSIGTNIGLGNLSPRGNILNIAGQFKLDGQDLVLAVERANNVRGSFI